MWPRLGPSIGRDGSVYAGSGDGDYYPEQQVFGQTIIAVKQNPVTKALEMTDWFTPTNAVWLRKRDLDMNVSGPIFEYKGREYIARIEQRVPDLADRHERDGRRGSSHPGLHDAARVQRGGPVRGGRPLECTRHVGRRRRHALGADAVLGPEAPAVLGTPGVRPGRERGDCRFPAGREERRPAAHARLDLAQHQPGRSRRHCQRRRIWFRQRRGRGAGVGRHRSGVQQGREPHRAIHPCGASCLRRAHGARSCGPAVPR